jgi:hypothetical protein
MYTTFFKRHLLLKRLLERSKDDARNVVQLRPKRPKRSPRWFGKVGQRRENVPVTVVHIYVFFHGHHPQFMVKMTTKTGPVLVWNTTTWSLVPPGRKGVLTATVKAHTIYGEEPQTRVGHCRLRRSVWPDKVPAIT